MNLAEFEIIGQGRQIDILKKIYSSERIPNAFLFYGPAGTGKHLTAINFLKLLNSKKTPAVDHNIEKLMEPYVQFVIPLPRGKGETNDSGPTEKLSEDTISLIHEEIRKKIDNPYHQIRIDDGFNIKISSIRDIKKKISLNFDDVAYRGIIISDAHLMSVEAQNALLKSLEEPPSGVVFFLITNNVSKLLPTIHSRCWNLEFQPLKPLEIENILIKYFNYEPDEVKKVSHFANGSVTFAQKLLENRFDYLLDKTITILRYSLGNKYNTAFSTFTEIIDGNSKEKFFIVMQLIMKWLDDVIKNKAGFEKYYFKDYKETFVKFNNKFNNVNIQETQSYLDWLSSLIYNNVSLNIIIMNTIFKLASLTKG